MRNVTAVLFESSMVKLTRCLFPLTCVLMALLLSSAGTAWAQEPDAEGSKDHPAFSRLQGYYINNYDEQEFSVFEFSLDPARRVEGHYWEIQYVLKEGARKAGALQIGAALEEGHHAIGQGFEAGVAVAGDQLHGQTTQQILSIARRPSRQMGQPA